ncbi:unnamed protein product [Angiostrongylus costaricensis]|uniref:Phosphatidylinositol-4,5-bisphosphate 4-phosphatase n=1 Tax=Angiostrongylus costaricensis TaxID=334426 RepID=A0A0R3PJF3_ANGCS|nr:unnamed protein product [Angiostrongylus costaricensis]
MHHDDVPNENVPLLKDEQRTQPYVEQNDGAEAAHRGSATVTCRVCEEQIELNGRDSQHVVKCSACHEATPIRPAPAGKKYVRCPCNCLLICKAASTRIACPRGNCRRVITLGHREPQGSAIRAPAGSCRVQCAHCSEVFLFNTLNNSLAHCPHCKRKSVVFSLFYFLLILLSSISNFLILMLDLLFFSTFVLSTVLGPV